MRPGDTTRKRAVEAAAHAINPGEFWDWPDAGPGVIAQRELWQANGVRAVDAAVPLVLDDIEASILRQVAPGPGEDGYAAGNGTFNEGLQRALHVIADLRVRNGWSRDSE